VSIISLAVISAVIIIMALLWGISAHNKIVKLSDTKDAAWSGVDVQLKRRLDLAPGLVEALKGCARHDCGILQELTGACNAVSAAATRNARIEAENALTKTLGVLSALLEEHPELDADVEFAKLKGELSSLGNDLLLKGRYYNGTVSDFNAAIQPFPAAFIARRLGYAEAALLEAEEPGL
jgi:LemA protein